MELYERTVAVVWDCVHGVQYTSFLSLCADGEDIEIVSTWKF